MKILDYIELIAAAPLSWASPIERWYTTMVPRPVRFVLVPARVVVCMVAAIAMVVWVIPFMAIASLHKTWKEFE